MHFQPLTSGARLLIFPLCAESIMIWKNYIYRSEKRKRRCILLNTRKLTNLSDFSSWRKSKIYFVLNPVPRHKIYVFIVVKNYSSGPFQTMILAMFWVKIAIVGQKQQFLHPILWSNRYYSCVKLPNNLRISRN